MLNRIKSGNFSSHTRTFPTPISLFTGSCEGDNYFWEMPIDNNNLQIETTSKIVKVEVGPTINPDSPYQFFTDYYGTFSEDKINLSLFKPGVYLVNITFNDSSNAAFYVNYHTDYKQEKAGLDPNFPNLYRRSDGDGKLTVFIKFNILRRIRKVDIPNSLWLVAINIFEGTPEHPARKFDEVKNVWVDATGLYDTTLAIMKKSGTKVLTPPAIYSWKEITDEIKKLYQKNKKRVNIILSAHGNDQLIMAGSEWPGGRAAIGRERYSKNDYINGVNKIAKKFAKEAKGMIASMVFDACSVAQTSKTNPDHVMHYLSGQLSIKDCPPVEIWAPTAVSVAIGTSHGAKEPFIAFPEGSYFNCSVGGIDGDSGTATRTKNIEVAR